MSNQKSTSMQSTSHLLMIRPVNFSFNTETAVNNAFQMAGASGNAQEKALKEFEGLVNTLRENGVDVTVIEDTPVPYTPDSIFPNNWVSFHEGGMICLYPMFAENRRKERKPAILDQLSRKFALGTATLDLSSYEAQGLFLEGTGSMVLDRENRIAYACLSPRTDREVLDAFCKRMDYTALAFTAKDARGFLIYHTNVMLCVADRYAVVCLDAIPDQAEKAVLIDSFQKNGKAIITITLDQMAHFAGNMLQVENDKGEKLLIMSAQAYHSLNKEQIDSLTAYNRILNAPLETIETNGGGSARCMLAEIFL